MRGHGHKERDSPRACEWLPMLGCRGTKRPGKAAGSRAKVPGLKGLLFSQEAAL